MTLFHALSLLCMVQGTCGAIYGVVPFVSRRSCGLCCGLVSAGGAIGGVMNQGIFFLNTAAAGPYCESPFFSFLTSLAWSFFLFSSKSCMLSQIVLWVFQLCIEQWNAAAHCGC